MSVESTGDDLSDPEVSVFALSLWASFQRYWDGADLSWKDGLDCVAKTDQRILFLFLSMDHNSADFGQKAARFALLGAEETARPLIARKIEHLRLDLATEPSPLFDLFWKQHEVEILTGIGIEAAAVTAILIASTDQKKDPVAGHLAGRFSSFLGLRRQKWGEIQFVANGIFLQERFYPLSQMLREFTAFDKRFSPRSSGIVQRSPSLFPSQGWIVRLGNAIRPLVAEKVGKAPLGLSHSTLSRSTTFILPGSGPPQNRIGGINGMLVPPHKALENPQYIRQLAPDETIEWTYNASHSFLGDLAEIVFLNYNGISPGVSALLKERWFEFCNEFKDQPGVKYLP